jgi:(S)-mandelate dehydrogenase
VSIADLRERARARLPAFALEYVEGGAEDEVSLAANRSDFDAWRLAPRTLVDTRERSLAVRLFGVERATPLVIAPTGLNGMICRDADAKLARAAAAEGLPFTLSTVSNVRLEALAAAVPGARWMQLYMFRDRSVSAEILARAADAGYEALVFTTDAQVFGNREWDRRSFSAPARLSLRMRAEVLRHPAWMLDVLGGGLPHFENLVGAYPRENLRADRGVFVLPPMFQPIDWDDLRWIRERWRGPLVVKGVLAVEDAVRAVEEGCEGVVVSNHGGRQLDGCVTALDVLPEIAAAVGSRAAVLMDGGIRLGRDVVKAMALGAHAVMIGRAVLYGLAAGGERGARRAIEILKSEVDRTLGQLGCRSSADVGPQLLRAARPAR